MWNEKVGLLLSEPFIEPKDGKFGQKAPVATPRGGNILVRTPTEEFFEGPFGKKIPIEHCDIFGPLRKLKGRVEYCKLRGDLPTKYLKHMIAKMDEKANPSVPVLALRVREEKAEAERMVWRTQVQVEDRARRKADMEAAGENV